MSDLPRMSRKIAYFWRNSASAWLRSSHDLVPATLPFIAFGFSPEAIARKREACSLAKLTERHDYFEDLSGVPIGAPRPFQAVRVQHLAVVTASTKV